MNTRPALFCVVALASGLRAQAPRTDSLRLSSFVRAAEQQDPRARELALLDAQSRLRKLNLDIERKPSLTVDAQAQYQSDVVTIPVNLPGGFSIPTPAHDTYDAHLTAQQRLLDFTLGARRGLEDAQLTESRARLRTSLYSVRQSVNDAYFTALRTETQAAEIETTITDLEAQLRTAQVRVREGAALPSEEHTIQAELLRRRQNVAELRAARRAALDILSDFTGTRVDSTAPLATPDVVADVNRVRAQIDELRQRPEYSQFAATKATLAQEENVRAAQDKPHVNAFGRAGYGRPGLDALSNKFDKYWLVGLQLQWAPWTWGAGDHDREVLQLQRQIVSAEEQNFAESVRRGVTQDLAAIDRLVSALVMDEEIIALRERIAAEARVRFNEGVIMAPEYVDRETDVLSARISRASHRAELAQSRARVLTTLGLEVR